MAKFRLWKSSSDSRWYWNLYSDRNRKIVCWAEGYSSEKEARDSIEWVRNNAPTAPVEPRRFVSLT